MAYSYSQSLGDGANRIFSVPFPYLSKPHVVISIDGAETIAFSWLSDTSIQLDVAPALGAVVDVRRKSSRQERLVDYQDGSVLTEAVLDQDSNQLFYISQEAFDSTVSTLQAVSDGTYDASSRRIKNLADPTAAQDAVTKSYVDVTTASSVAAAAASAGASQGYSESSAASSVAAAESVVSAQALLDETTVKAGEASASAAEAAESAAMNDPTTLVHKDGAEDITGDKTLSGKTTLSHYTELFTDVADSTAALVIDCSGTVIRKVLLTNDCAMSFTAVPSGTAFNLTLALVQDPTGSRVVTWPVSVKWPNGVVPTLTTDPDKVDFVTLLTLDAGVTWFGFVSGQAY